MARLSNVLRTGLAFLAAAASAAAQGNNPVLSENTTKISDHVWAIMGWPNIGIVVGSSAVLVVDTGLGPKNGETISRVVAKLAPGKKIYLTTTHFHPEHASGETGFPAGTTLIRDAVQQQEMEKHGQEMIDQFAGRSPQQKELLAGVKPRQPDETFDKEKTLDLGGGVIARLLWFGGAHTKGDELTFVEPDRTLISGDVVQNKTMPNIYGDGGTPSSWLAVVEKIETLHPAHVLPDHSAPGDGSLVTEERSLISDIVTRAKELKNKGISAADAGRQISEELKSKHPDWPNTNAGGFVNSVYAEQ
ncbi:MAG TPA: MBL fold metallo-hydrolase [Bryobacteraceae bacterium]|nr:MBL fold metallo-hydrolase [Bryobacteraceae bacterium]